MKLILMMVREDKVEPVRNALNQLNIRDVAVCQVEDFSPQRRPQGVWRGRVYTLDCTVKMEIQCVVHDDEADGAVRASPLRSAGPAVPETDTSSWCRLSTATTSTMASGMFREQPAVCQRLPLYPRLSRALRRARRVSSHLAIIGRF